MADAVDDATTVLDRFLAAGISRASFDTHVAAGQIAVDGERITIRPLRHRNPPS